jgi:hypothetical protein
MNFINKGFLGLALLPGGIYKRMGVNTRQLKTILVTKLTIDDRRPNAIHHTQQRKKEKPITASTIGTIVVSTLLGLVYLVAFAIGQDQITKLTFYFSFFFFMLAASLISDFTAVLIDVRDNYIILPKPVNDRTIVTARILHIFIHICKLVVPMCLPGLVTVSALYGAWAGFCFLLMVLMVTLFTIFFINALYIVILRITTPQKFQAIISYVQVIFAIVLYASYQVLPRMMENFDGITFSADTNPLFLIFPSYWFACGWNALFSAGGTLLEWTAAAASIVIPIASLFIVIKYLAPSFNNKLATIGSVATEKPSAMVGGTKAKRWAYPHFLGSLFTKSGPERMGFLFTWKMSARSRDFRLKVYPSIGYLLVYVVFVLLQNRNLSFDEMRSNADTGRMMLVSALYIGSYLPIMAIYQSAVSDKYKAAWLYYTTPVQKPGSIIRGSTKASILKFFIPLALLTLVAGLSIIGLNSLPNILLGLVNQLLLACLVVYMSQQKLPFSVHEGTQKKTGSFMRGLLILIVSGMVGLAHYFIYNFIPVVIVFILLSIIATWLLMDGLKNISWERIIKEDRE